MSESQSQMTQEISLPTIRRFPMYLRLLHQLADSGEPTVSSSAIAREFDLEAIVVRKDLAVTGIVGKPRIGFNIRQLIDAIEKIINLHNHSDAFLVGTGNLGTALMGYKGFEHYGLNIVAGFDVDPEKIGTTLHGKKVFALDRMVDIGLRMHVHLGILCVHDSAAQDVVDLMVKAGIRGIWNFTPVKLKVPQGVVVQREDLSAGLAVLSVQLGRLFDRKPEALSRQLSQHALENP